MENNKKEFEVSRHESYENFLVLKGKGVELIYIEKLKPGSTWIERSHGTVENGGYNIKTEEVGGRKSWMKQGRGRMKNEDRIWELVRAADDFMLQQGYGYWYN